MSSEIQSKHFGASKSQITLHTGYFITGSMETIQSFCGVSDILQHDPITVWAFLSPILQYIRELFPAVDTLHFYSDGPTTQYRQKLNFYLFSTVIFELGFGFVKAYWNFQAAGHGKGIPDGIGAVVKRSADMRVRHGHDVTNASSLIEQVTKSSEKVHLYEIDEHMVRQIEEKIKDKTVKTIPGTMKMHQLITEIPEVVKNRGTSCLCEKTFALVINCQSLSFLLTR